MGRARKPPPESRMRQLPRWCMSADRLRTEESWSAMSDSERVDALVATAWAKRLALPHVVHLVERATGDASVFGPFADPLRASVFADRLLTDLTDAVPSEFIATVIPLEPPE